MSAELIYDTISIIASEATTESGTIFVKGLFTTDLIDRERQFVDPLQFNLETFANTGTLLRNHKFIKDNNGNDEPAGKVVKTVPVKVLQENPEDSSEWILKSLVSEDIIGTWPKQKSPDLTIGDRGIYVVAEVTHPTVVQQVVRKELGAFSWTGLSMPVKRGNVEELTNVDLLEISLVNIPANPNSTFIITDENDETLNMEVSLKNVGIYQVGFDKVDYSLDSIRKYTKNYTNTSIISENSDNYFVQVGEPSLVDTAKSFGLQIGGRYLIAAPKIEKNVNLVPILGELETKLISENIMSEDVTTQSEDSTPVEAEKFYLMDIEALKSRLPNTVVSLQKSTTIADQPVEFHFVEFTAEEVSKTVEETTTETESAPVEEAAPVEETTTETEAAPVEEAAPVQDATSERLDQLTAVVETLAQAIQAKIETPAEETVETVSKSAEEIKEELSKEFEEKLAEFKAQEAALEAQKAETEAQREKLQKSLERINSFGTAVPPQTEREDKTITSKSTEVSPSISSVDFFANQIMKGI